MIYNKKFIIGALLLFGIFGVIIITISISANHKATPNNASTSTTPVAVYTSLHIDNFSSYWGMDTTTQTAVQDGIDHYLGDAHSTASRVGSIRQGTFKRVVDGTTSTIVFLVDIANLKRSYKVSLGSDTSTGEHSLYVLCPSSNELIYPAFTCKDDLSEQTQ